MSIAAPARGAGPTALHGERRVPAPERLHSAGLQDVSNRHVGGTLLVLLAGSQLVWFVLLAYVLVRLGM